jgi:DNA-binding transcriptional LysR family regulator
MRITHLRQADLNLLVVFSALAEEGSVTRAASRLLLSQPATSRALQRLRETFHDDLLIRTPHGYEPTPKGRRLVRELEKTLPQLDRLIAEGDFDPATEEAVFRIAATDHAGHLLIPALFAAVFSKTVKVRFEFVPLHGGQYEALDRGRLDLVLNADDGTVPNHLSKEMMFEVDFVCVVSAKSKFKRAITLKQYLAASHVAVDIIGGVQTILEKHLGAIGEKRRCPLVVAYHTTAMRVAAVSDMIATIPRRMARLESSNESIRLLEGPRELGSFQYAMIWHPRMNTDAAHRWLRSTVRGLGQDLP